jgi:hypothetical protein
MLDAHGAGFNMSSIARATVGICFKRFVNLALKELSQRN